MLVLKYLQSDVEQINDSGIELSASLDSIPYLGQAPMSVSLDTRVVIALPNGGINSMLSDVVLTADELVYSAIVSIGSSEQSFWISQFMEPYQKWWKAKKIIATTDYFLLWYHKEGSRHIIELTPSNQMTWGKAGMYWDYFANIPRGFEVVAEYEEYYTSPRYSYRAEVPPSELSKPIGQWVVPGFVGSDAKSPLGSFMTEANDSMVTTRNSIELKMESLIVGVFDVNGTLKGFPKFFDDKLLRVQTYGLAQRYNVLNKLVNFSLEDANLDLSDFFIPPKKLYLEDDVAGVTVLLRK